jgi:hypothetical protein
MSVRALSEALLKVRLAGLHIMLMILPVNISYRTGRTRSKSCYAHNDIKQISLMGQDHKIRNGNQHLLIQTGSHHLNHRWHTRSVTRPQGTQATKNYRRPSSTTRSRSPGPLTALKVIQPVMLQGEQGTDAVTSHNVGQGPQISGQLNKEETTERQVISHFFLFLITTM